MKMKKIVFTKPEKVELQVADANYSIENPDEVVVKNMYSLISAGTELACLSGSESWFILPNIPGYISVGEVTDIGSRVTKVKKGDKIFTNGPHSEYFKINTADRYGGMCIKIPQNLNLDYALFTRMASVAMTSVRISNIEIGDFVLVLGLGQVGNFAAQLAQIQGAQVIAADLSAKRRVKAEECGIIFTVDPSSADWKDRIKKISAARGISAIIDATGLSSVIAEASDLVSPYGEIILLGSPRAPFETNATNIYRCIHLPGFPNFKSALEWRYPTFKDEFVKHSIERNSEIIMELIADGKLKIKPLYSHKLKPENAPEAYAGLKMKKDDYIGVVFDWTM